VSTRASPFQVPFSPRRENTEDFKLEWPAYAYLGDNL
jgi:hypothetical protein